jgi:DNA-binding NtrC family response regulator
VKLLRLLQEKEYRPLGSRKTCKVDVRVIAAANGCFEELLRSGKFRSDLFYRLNVISLSIPPLRKRKEDIPLLARHLVAKYALEYSRTVHAISQQAMSKLINHDWPGNVRELENIIAGAVALSERPTIEAEEIQLSATSSVGDLSFKALKARAVAEFETSYIRRLLIENDGNISKAASAAKKHRRAFWQLMHKHHITLPVVRAVTDPSGQSCSQRRTDLS